MENRIGSPSFTSFTWHWRKPRDIFKLFPVVLHSDQSTSVISPIPTYRMLALVSTWSVTSNTYTNITSQYSAHTFFARWCCTKTISCASKIYRDTLTRLHQRSTLMVAVQACKLTLSSQSDQALAQSLTHRKLTPPMESALPSRLTAHWQT